MAVTFDIVLQYYDNPKTLHHWLARLLLRSDFMQFADRANIIIADTGTPVDRIPATLDVLKRWACYKRAIYVRAETEKIRASVAADEHARPIPQAVNVCAKEVSRADVLYYSVLGFLYLPSYFRQTLSYHEQNERILLQPKQCRLHSEKYHIWYYDQPMARALASGSVSSYGGMPDFSVRRKHVLEIGGWDEKIITWGMCDVDVCARLTGKIDVGSPAEEFCRTFLGQEKEPFKNFGLEMVMPHSDTLFSPICNDYPDHFPDADKRRRTSWRRNVEYFVSRWGEIQRNQDAEPVAFEVIAK